MIWRFILKRDLDIIRDILLAVENDDTHMISVYDISCILGITPEAAKYHVGLLKDQEFIIIHGGYIATGPVFKKYDFIKIERLTFAGCDYLDAIRNDNIWAKVKERLAKIGGNTALDVVKSLAVDVTLSYFK